MLCQPQLKHRETIHLTTQQLAGLRQFTYNNEAMFNAIFKFESY